MNSASTDLSPLNRIKFVVEMFMLGCAILAFGWIGAALVPVFGDAELRHDIFRVFWYLWVWLALVPLCGFGVCWCWRSILMRKIGEMDLHDKTPAA
jgi:hypothetical protein